MKKIIVLSFIICGIFTSVNAQWEQMNGPYDNNIFCFATGTNSIGGTNLFAGTYNGGVLFSTDNGKSWTGPLWNTGLVGITVRSLVTIPGSSGSTNLFAGTEKGLYLSTDNGDTWKKINIGVTDPVVFSLTTYANSSGGINLFAGVESGGVYLSTDKGTSWKAVSIAATSYHVMSLTTITSGTTTNLFAGTNGGGVFRSTNSGTSWTEVNTGLTAKSVQTLVVDGSNLLAGTQAGGVFYSTNNGTSWTALTKTGLITPYINAMTVKDGTLYVATDYGACSLVKDATTWTEVNTGLTTKKIGSITTVSNGNGGKNLLAGTSEGFFVSTDNGANWKMSNVGISNMDVRALAVFSDGTNGTNLFAGASMTGIKVTSDGGASWAASMTGFPTTGGAISISAFATRTNGSDSTYFFAGTPYSGVYLSTDKGKSWKASSSGLTSFEVRTLLVNGTKLYAATKGGVFVSGNNAKTWKAINTGLPTTDISAITASENNLFAANSVYQTGGVSLSSNDGINWTSVNTGLEYASGGYNQLNCLVANGTDIFAGGWGIFRSTNNGANWTNSKAKIGTPYITSFLVTGKHIFAGDQGGQVYLSINGGVSWTTVGTGLLSGSSINSMITMPDGKGGANLLAGTGRGIWVRPMTEMVTGIEDALNVLHANALLQNYPNPFSTQTTIKYRVTASGFVSLKVYDAMGTEVASLLNERKQAGNYSFEWDAAGLGSGVYFCQIQNGGNVEVKKMILQK